MDTGAYMCRRVSILQDVGMNPYAWRLGAAARVLVDT